jgi:hypothetical protein
MTRSTTFGCARCYSCPPLDAWVHRREQRLVARPVDESHFSISVLACPQCDQRFVSVFTEEIDWVDGDDPQRWLTVPITGDEAAALIATGASVSAAAVERLAAGRRYLDADFPKGAPTRIAWASGGFFIPRHS